MEEPSGARTATSKRAVSLRGRKPLEVCLAMKGTDISVASAASITSQRNRIAKRSSTM